MNTVSVSKRDIYKTIYFITALTQRQTSSSMQGALSSKGDLMGGIFDRWINTVPEGILFNKMILPSLNTNKEVETISDYYMYDPRIAGIAPDVIGLRINGKTVPFSIYNEHWTPVENAPQIEIKTFKKPQKMISLRNQSYDDKYLIMAESEFRIDYLLPFFDQSIFNKEIHDLMTMDDNAFIISNNENNIHGISEVDISNDIIGEITLLKITTAKEFMSSSTLCEGTVSVQRIGDIEKKTRQPSGILINQNLSEFASKTDCGLYRFNENWYEGVTEDGIPFYTKNSKGTKNRFLFRTLDFYTDDISKIVVLKKSNSSMYLKTLGQVAFNEYELEKDAVYKVDFSILDRSSNDGEEYFMQKSLVSHIPDYEKTLLNKLAEIVENEKV